MVEAGIEQQLGLYRFHEAELKGLLRSHNPFHVCFRTPKSAGFHELVRSPWGNTQGQTNHTVLPIPKKPVRFWTQIK